MTSAHHDHPSCWRPYDNPKFVEDLVRDIAPRLQRDPRISKSVVASGAHFIAPTALLYRQPGGGRPR